MKPVYRWEDKTEIGFERSVFYLERKVLTRIFGHVYERDGDEDITKNCLNC